MSLQYLERNKLIREFETRLARDEAMLFCVRGRRRVGKSSILNDVYGLLPRHLTFFYTGKKDRTPGGALRDFAQAFDSYAKKTYFSLIPARNLSWGLLFKGIEEFAIAQEGELTLIFDEVQWIAGEKSGFVGQLKESWLQWQRNTKIKVILCGSSQKFFKKMMEGDESILRGLATQSAIWVKPFSLSTVREKVLPHWSLAQQALAHMIFGGIPYYLQTLDPHRGFIHALNDALFTKRTILLDEPNDVLGLDFNRAGLATAKQVITVLKPFGSTRKEIAESLGASEVAMHKMVEKLLEYGILGEVFPGGKPKRISRQSVRYVCEDFFLNFYFRVLQKYEKQIRNNDTGLLAPNLLFQPPSSLYIPGFTGGAFELLVKKSLLEGKEREGALHDKLWLSDENFQVFSVHRKQKKEAEWNERGTQIDLVVEHPGDHISRIIECKWAEENLAHLDEVLSKAYPLDDGWMRKNFLAVSYFPSPSFLKKAKELDVGIITLDQL